MQIHRKLARLSQALLASAALIGASANALAEDGYDLWLRYRAVDASAYPALHANVRQLVTGSQTPTLAAAEAELVRGFRGLRGQAVMGTLVATPAPDPESLRALTDALPAPDLASATAVDGALVCRYLGPSAERARGLFTRIWAALRPAVMSRRAETPRIWLT